MSPRTVLPGGLLALASAVAALTYAPSALAADVAWTGASTASQNWSDAANWSAPLTSTEGSPIGTLTFGDLPGCDPGAASPAPAGSACYTGFDDVSNVYAQQLQLGANGFYNMYPTGRTQFLWLEGNGGSPNVGLTAMPMNGNQQIGNIIVPLELTSDQTWQIGSGGVGGYANLYLGGLGQPHNLTLELNNGWLYADDVDNYSGTDPNSNTVTAEGPGELQLDYSPDFAPRLPAVRVADDSAGTGTALGIATPGATSGSITFTGTQNNFIVLTDRAPNETTLAVTGNVTLDSSTNMEFDIDGNNTTPGVDSSQLTATGTVNFGGGDISLWQAKNNGNCDTLTPGNTYTLLKAAALTGPLQIGNTTITQGQSAAVTLQSNARDCLGSPAATAIVNYNATTITATIAGAPATSGAGPQIAGTPTVGDKLTVSSNGGWTGTPTPSYTYQWYSCSGTSCSAIAGATGSSYVLTSAEAGKTVKVQVTATNAYGSASAFSNTLGPVASTSSGSGGTGGSGGSSGSGGGGSTTLITPALSTLIRADLNRLGHPVGRHAMILVLRRGLYRARFVSPAAGFLTVVWRAHVSIRQGKHVRHVTLVIARGVAHTPTTGSAMLTIRLTAAGKRILRADPFHLHVIASERFLAPGVGWTSLTKRFIL